MFGVAQGCQSIIPSHTDMLVAFVDESNNLGSIELRRITSLLFLATFPFG